MKKKFALLMILMGITVATFAQSSVLWKNAVTVKGNNVKSITADKSGNIYACVFDMGPMNKVKGVYLNKFSPDLEFDSKIELNAEMPEIYDAWFVLDYVCILAKGNNVYFYDLAGKLAKKTDLDPEYAYNIITGNWFNAIVNNNYSGIKKVSNISVSNDQNHIIIWGYKKTGNPKNKMDKNNGIKMYAFDRKLDQVAEKTFGFEDVFSNTAEVNSLQFDISPKNKVIALCSNIPKPGQAQVFLAVFDEADKSPVVHKYSFKFEEPSFVYDFGKMDEIYISGVISEGRFRPSMKRTSDRSLYFINQSLSDKKSATPIIYDMEDQIYRVYTEYSGKLRTNSIDPFGIFVMDDGIMYGAMDIQQYTKTTTSSIGGMSSSSSSTYYLSKSLTFIKFSFTGNIQWLKMINKEVKMSDGYEKMARLGFAQDENKLKVVYCDNPANIINKSTKLVRGAMLKTVPAYAEITSGGDISVIALDKLGKLKLMNYPDESLLVNNNVILLDFKLKGFFNRDYFIGKAMIP
jgi:hypothetical protein